MVRSSELHTQLSESDLQPGSLQHVQLELHFNSECQAGELLQVLESVYPAAGKCKLVFEGGAVEAQIQLGFSLSDADMLGSLADALRQPGVEVGLEWEGFRELPGDNSCALQGTCGVSAAYGPSRVAGHHRSAGQPARGAPHR